MRGGEKTGGRGEKSRGKRGGGIRGQTSQTPKNHTDNRSVSAFVFVSQVGSPKVTDSTFPQKFIIKCFKTG